MIHVGILSDRSSAADFIKANSIAPQDVLLEAEIGGSRVGLAAVRMENNTVRILAADYSEKDILELMLRAAFSYGERRGAENVLINFSQPSDLLSALGFRQIDGQIRAKVENVVHMCRNCAGDND